MLDPRTGEQVRPVRIHSSGDFYSPRYAQAWIDVANRHHDIVFWAPTRTWAAAGWVEHWRKLLPKVKHGNFVVRPSAYHTGDIAPNENNHPWPGSYPFQITMATHPDDPPSHRHKVTPVAGTTSIYAFDDRRAPADGRYDWGCRAYAVLKDAKDCRHAAAPDGSDSGCRACWLRPDLRINYTTH
jgi:hypothetical protein